MHHVIVEKSEGRWVQGRLFQEKPLRKVSAGEEDSKLGTTNLGERLTMDGSMSIEELEAHLNRIAEEWDRSRGLEKSERAHHKYIKRTGTPGHYQYWYPTPEATSTMSATAHAKQLGSKLTYDQAKKLWEEWKEIQHTPHPKDLHELGQRAMRSQLLRETVEGFLGSMEDAMTPEAIDAKLYGGKSFRMKGKAKAAKTFKMSVEESSEREIKSLMKTYHLKEITLLKDESSEHALNYLHNLLDHLSGKMEINGDGILKIKVGDIDEAGTSAFYHAPTTEIELDKKYTDTFAHEYAHFVFDKKISMATRNTYYWWFPSEDDMSPKRREDWNRLKDNVSAENLDALFKPFFSDLNKGEYTSQEKASIELLHKLVDYHKKNIGNLDKSNHFRFTYLLDPSEMIARAVSYYADDDILPMSQHLENNPGWKRIVKAWGDKYLRTGIFKSFIVLLGGRHDS